MSKWIRLNLEGDIWLSCKQTTPQRRFLICVIWGRHRKLDFVPGYRGAQRGTVITQTVVSSTHKRHPMIRPWGRVRGCLLWVKLWSLFYIYYCLGVNNIALYGIALYRSSTVKLYRDSVWFQGTIYSTSQEIVLYIRFDIWCALLWFRYWATLPVSFRVMSLTIVSGRNLYSFDSYILAKMSRENVEFRPLFFIKIGPNQDKGK